MSWNKVLDLVVEIKHNYINRFEDDTIDLKLWIEKLDFKIYNDIFDCLQINQHENLVLIRYGLHEMARGMWDNPSSIYRECRSLVIDLKNEELVMTPFRKFFNLNEVKENSVENVRKKIENATLFEISDKADGSMQCARYYNGKFLMTGSMALNPNDSWRLEDGYKMLKTNYKQMLIDNPNTTFIFEYISIKDAHVVLYDKSDEGLYLIGMRNVLDGKESTYKEVIEVADKYDVKHMELENITLDEMLKQMKTVKSHEKEGWVINIDGHKIKLKADDYTQVHRMLDKVSSINVIIKNIANDTYDDLISKIPDLHKDRVGGIAKKIFEYKLNVEKDVATFHRIFYKKDIKEFMISVDMNVPKELAGYVKNEYLGKEWNALTCRHRYKRFDELNIDMEG